MKKSLITKRLTRKLSTAPYENVEVSVEFQEEVEFSRSGDCQEQLDTSTKFKFRTFWRLTKHPLSYRTSLFS